MSRIAKKPISLPKNVKITLNENTILVEGAKGQLSLEKPEGVTVHIKDQEVSLTFSNPQYIPITGTIRAILSNMVKGVSESFQRKLELVGVGYRASMQGKDLNLSLGFSHPTIFTAPDGISLSTPSQTEIVVTGLDKQLVGLVAAKIRRFRPPEPYKGKGVKYAGEVIIRKEAKKA